MEDTTRKMLLVWMTVMMLCRMTWGHGTMVQPPQRSSMWRDARFTSAPRNYDDNALYCGGFSRQWRLNHGKCGICGDAYDAPSPRPNEAGGQYATGVIVETYQRGQVIDVAVKITANHMGYFLFKLCPNNDVTKEATQECLDQHILHAVGENGEDLGEKYYIDHAVDVKHLRLQLPPDVTCTQCVLQWDYMTANSWGCENGRCCVGCGPQENFVNCADIAITGSGDSGHPHTQAPVTTRAPTTTTTERPRVTDAPTTPRPTTTTPRPTTTTPRPTTTTPRPTTTTPRPTTTTPRPTTATPRPTPRTVQPTTTTTTTRRPAETAAPAGKHCVAVGIYSRMSGMNNWCVTNCAKNYCPSTHCRCS